jgi:hypothetical protein
LFKVCDYKDLNLKPDEFVLNNDCTKTTCTAEGDVFSIRSVSCGVANVEGCRLEPDFTLEYPGYVVEVLKFIQIQLILLLQIAATGFVQKLVPDTNKMLCKRELQ